MTVDQLIAALQRLSADGHGTREVVTVHAQGGEFNPGGAGVVLESDRPGERLAGFDLPAPKEAG